MAGLSTRAYQEFRADMKALWQPVNAPCHLCGMATIDWDGPKNEPDSFELDHIKPRRNFPELTLDPTNAAPSHHRCNRHKGAGVVVAGIGVTSEAW